MPLLLCLLVISLVGCRAGEQPTSDAAAPVLEPSPSLVATAEVPSAPPATASSTPSSAPRSDAGGPECRSKAECAAGEECLFETGSCSAAGRCTPAGAIPHRRCNIAVAMCSCDRKVTFHGQGGCAGAATEPWELYACRCSSDADCRNGQRCVPVSGSKPHAPDATHECRDPV